MPKLTEQEISREAAARLESLMRQVPIVVDATIQKEARLDGLVIDFLATVTTGNESHRLVCEVKSRVHPRQARIAALELADIIERQGNDATGVLVSTYLSPSSRSICKERGIGYLDLQGNARIAFNGVLVERETSDTPATERRKLKSLFRPKSARVLKVLLADPARAWRVAELVEEAGVSIGHISKLRTMLLDREIGQVNEDGLFLRDPDRLLDEWQAEYEGPEGMRCEFYTTLHGERLAGTLRELMADSPERPDLVLSSFSAAEWLAPYARYGGIMLYADARGLARLEDALALEGVPSGSNVDVVVLEGRDILDESARLDSGHICTSPVQTYLDLSLQGDRGKEAAEFIRAKLLNWGLEQFT